MKIKIVVLFLLLLNCLSFAGADFPERPQPPRLVNDLAGLIDDSQEQLLEQKLVHYNDSTSTQIAVVTITDIGGYDAADYSFQLSEKWGIGQRGKNNGVLILVVKETRDVFIATGYGLEEFIPDAIAKRIIQNVVIPNFKAGKFYEGLDDATSTIIMLLSGKFDAEELVKKNEKRSIPWLPIVLIIIIALMARRKGGGGGRGLGRTLMAPTYGGWRNFSSGGGIFGGSSGGGGGFGGFGGGSFGGGGAGGKW